MLSAQATGVARCSPLQLLGCDRVLGHDLIHSVACSSRGLDVRTDLQRTVKCLLNPSLGTLKASANSSLYCKTSSACQRNTQPPLATKVADLAPPTEEWSPTLARTTPPTHQNHQGGPYCDTANCSRLHFDMPKHAGNQTMTTIEGLHRDYIGIM